jgi:hypothetical protein
VNNPPYIPTDGSPDSVEDVSINPTLSVYAEDPDSDMLYVSFYNEIDVLLGTVSDVTSGTYAVLALSGLEHETWYNWYAVVSDGEYENTSDLFTFKTVEYTDTDPIVEITTPVVESIYLRGFHFNAAFLENAIVLGGINITVDADDLDGTITEIEYKIDDEVVSTTTNNYYYWNEQAFGWRTITVKVTDNMDNTAEDSMDIFILNLGK